MLLKTTEKALAEYKRFDTDEARFYEEMLRLLADGTNAFQRDHFSPGHFTASAFVLSPDRQKLLLILHRKLQKWLQPGGHVELHDQSLWHAAQREVYEEVGVEIVEQNPEIFDLDIHVIPARKNELQHRHFDVRFLFVAPSFDFRVDPEVADGRWVVLSEISTLTNDRSVLRATHKLQNISQIKQ